MSASQPNEPETAFDIGSEITDFTLLKPRHQALRDSSGEIILPNPKDFVVIKQEGNSVKLDRGAQPWLAGMHAAVHTEATVTRDSLPTSDVLLALYGRLSTILQPGNAPLVVDALAMKGLVLPASNRWREALSTALLGNWADPLEQHGRLSPDALGVLKSEARALHRGLVPLWKRRTRHGRVLSLDAALGDGLSLYDLVPADVDLLTHTPGGVFEDERLNAVLRALESAERQVVFAYAEGAGTTWTEAAEAVGAADPEAFGERVRRKAKRLAAEQRRRTTQRVSTSRAPELRG
ncbi:hypothetical protein ACFT8Q_08065 [Streptomyces griseoincarnatus]